MRAREFGLTSFSARVGIWGYGSCLSASTLSPTPNGTSAFEHLFVYCARQRLPTPAKQSLVARRRLCCQNRIAIAFAKAACLATSAEAALHQPSNHHPERISLAFIALVCMPIGIAYRAIWLPCVSQPRLVLCYDTVLLSCQPCEIGTGDTITLASASLS